uniref:Uncharacterized protein n=1 Tax=Nelumbo nucifera TaxID=4432 RepID=A0A822ZEK1_NELNU|nr:TPA_asm: hypothetical protein HUJ06_015759 [Nelumbo nucifera]
MCHYLLNSIAVSQVEPNWSSKTVFEQHREEEDEQCSGKLWSC